MNGTLSIESLGFTKEDLEDRVVELAVERLLRTRGFDEDGEETSKASALSERLKAALLDRIDSAVREIAEKHILPNAAQYIENVTFQKTNQWGESKEPPLTFREYLAKQAENYLTEQVNYEGKSKSEDSYNFRGTQTRITHMVHKHLHSEIERLMKDAVADANNKIASGIQEAVKMKLGEITNGLKLSVSVK